MKNWIYMLGVIIVYIMKISDAVAANKIAIANVANIFQQSAQRAETIKQLEYEFKDRATELEMMEHDLQLKMQTLQKDGSTMTDNDRNELEKSLVSQREIFSNKAKIFQQENHARQTEERDKILDIIYSAVKNIAKKENYDIVIDTNAVVYSNSKIKDITDSVIKQVG